jgi:hypothetical protein
LVAHVLIQFIEGTTGFRFFKNLVTANYGRCVSQAGGAGRAVGGEPLRRGPRQTAAIVRERRRVPRRSRDAD